jgi:succinyl-diaminopimelate desuccinylase
MNVLSLTRKLLSFNNINPPGNEGDIAEFAGNFLHNNGFNVKYHDFGHNRLHLIAERGLSSKPPIVLSGHFDTVPLGNKKWEMDPFGNDVSDDKLWGRGSSDMKGGLAAMMIAAAEAFSGDPPEGGVRLIFSAGEELGCQGIAELAKDNFIPGKASAVIVGEPTGNLPVTGHKGAVYLHAVASGKTAHSSMPEMGDNAIYKAVRAITGIMEFDFEAQKDELLGFPSLNVGKINGGMNINSVPDHAEFTIDLRTTTKVDHEKIISKISAITGKEGVVLEKSVDLKPVFTSGNDPFVQIVYDVCGIDKNSQPLALPYLTDGAMLQKVYNSPVVILGPGEPSQAHQTDEYCFIDKLRNSVVIYRDIILKWSRT